MISHEWTQQTAAAVLSEFAGSAGYRTIKAKPRQEARKWVKPSTKEHCHKGLVSSFDLTFVLASFPGSTAMTKGARVTAK